MKKFAVAVAIAFSIFNFAETEAADNFQAKTYANFKTPAQLQKERQDRQRYENQRREWERWERERGMKNKPPEAPPPFPVRP